MSKIVIGIHGLANKPKADVLEKGWKDAMLEGLKKNAGIAAQDDTFEFESVYWADVMYEKHDEKYDKYKEAKLGELKRYEDGWLDSLRASASEVVGGASDALKNWFSIDKIADEVLKHKLKDLHEYYNKQDKRNKLRDLLKESILRNKDKKIMVIAHSMGTIISYDVLREIGRAHPGLSIEHYVTIGSPLGLPHVKMKISEENSLVRTPSVVRKWSNLADWRDPVALDTHLSNDYQPNDFGIKVRDDLVLNDWGGIHHKSYGYLRTPEFTDLLKRFI